MRGRGYVFPGNLPYLGITPARAGKRLSLDPDGRPTGDHPRACGEEKNRGLSCVASAGSPPRVRGRAALRHSVVCAQRITPARAGKSGNSLFRFLFSGDHPRACGEEAYSIVTAWSVWGSPPRVRGRVDCKPRVQQKKGSPPRVRGRGSVNCACWQKKGITPARAGKSQSPYRSG